MPALFSSTSPLSAMRTSIPAHGRPTVFGFASASGWMETSALVSVEP
jgi:hypothetical protein